MQSKKVYIAPDGFLAFIDRAHPKHVHASAFFRYFAQEHYQLYTSLVSINQTCEEISRNISPSLAKDFLRAMSLSSINIFYPEISDHKTTCKIMFGSSSTELTYAKTLMTVLCTKRSIPQICTFEYLPSLFGLTAFYLPM